MSLIMTVQKLRLLKRHMRCLTEWFLMLQEKGRIKTMELQRSGD